MKRFILAVVLLFAASSARAELYDGTQPLGVGDPGVPSGNYEWYSFSIDTKNSSVYVHTENISSTRALAIGGQVAIDNAGVLDYYNLVPGGPLSFLSPSGCFVADNVIDFSRWMGVDQYGLLFSSNLGEVNVFTDPLNGGALTTIISSDCHSVPEPSSMAIAGVALSFMLAGYLRRRRYS